MRLANPARIARAPTPNDEFLALGALDVEPVRRPVANVSTIDTLRDAPLRCRMLLRPPYYEHAQRPPYFPVDALSHHGLGSMCRYDTGEGRQIWHCL